MDRYFVTSRVNITFGLDAKNESDAKKTAIAEMKDLIARLTHTESIGLGAKFETSEFDVSVEKLPF